MRRLPLLLLLVLPARPASNLDKLPVAKRMEMIEKGKVDAGARIRFGESELNVYLSQKVKEVVPRGLRNPRVQIGDGKATAHALADFVKMRHARGEQMGWLMRKLLEGEHQLTIIGTLESGAGRGRVDIEQVEIGGTSLKGRTLDLLIRTFLTPLYPQAKPGQSFELGYDMERIDLKPGRAEVTMAQRKQWKQRRSAKPMASAALPAQ
ncbi:MAG: hypothetical protein SFV51_07425 [Bryobacteraceae bacterium]|nr:hypothetical protein [Bryobacteraceae bacterium]